MFFDERLYNEDVLMKQPPHWSRDLARRVPEADDEACESTTERCVPPSCESG
jgi:hypothetical protein